MDIEEINQEDAHFQDADTLRSTWMNRAKPCRTCGQVAVPGTTDLSWDLCGQRIVVRVPGKTCGCGDACLGFDAGRAEQVAALEALSKLPDKADAMSVRFARKSMGMKRQDLAVALGVDEAMVEGIERGDVRCTRMYVLSLVSLLRWAVEDSYWRILSGQQVRLPWRGGSIQLIDLTRATSG